MSAVAQGQRFQQPGAGSMQPGVGVQDGKPLPRKTKSKRKSLDAVQAYAAAEVAQQIRNAIATHQGDASPASSQGHGEEPAPLKPLIQGPEDMTEGMTHPRTIQCGNMVMTYGAASFVGMHPTQAAKVNQDAWVAVESFLSNSRKCLLGVFDGHGANGHLVSNYLVAAVPMALAAALESAPSVSQAWAQAFSSCHSELKRHPTINANMSGSTAVVCLLDGNELVVGNLGDSRCVVGGIQDNETTAQAMSRDHTPELEEEKQRVIQMGGEVRPLLFRGQGFGPPRVWVRGSNRPGLCMTRSFGDIVAHMVGVSHLPELQFLTLRSTDKYIVVCSDGISQFLDDLAIIDIVHSRAELGHEPHEVARYLCRRAAEEWRKYDTSIDDCTAIVAFLDVEDDEGECSRFSDEHSNHVEDEQGAHTSAAARAVARSASMQIQANMPLATVPSATGSGHRIHQRRTSMPGLRPQNPVLPTESGDMAGQLPPDMQGFSMRRLKDALSLKSGALGRMFRRRVSLPGGPQAVRNMPGQPSLPELPNE